MEFHPCKPATLYGDRTRIMQVMTNFADNAVKYSGDDKFIDIKLTRSGKKVAFHCIDHGVGIPSDEISHVWDKYYRTSANHERAIEGTGLGLAIVKGILNLHNAKFGVESEEGKGSDFWFELETVRKPRKERKEKERKMAKKAKTVFMCSDCGNEYPSWQGQCSYCGAWNTIVEHKIKDLEEPALDTRRRTGTGGGRPVKLGSVGTADYARIDTGIGELNRVLGGGVVLGSLVLISGEPGIGKSTIIAQTANNIANTYGPVLYVSGEESEEQVKLRADRICGSISDNFLIYPETNIASPESSPVLRP